MDGYAGENENRVVGNKRADDAEHQKSEDCEITVVREEVIE